MESLLSEKKKYFAFISYSHDDKTFARKLHRKLENYNISTVTDTKNNKQKLYPVCRDETAFSTGKLDNIIKEKLDESKKLIVICTHTSVASGYVCEEVNYFAEKSGLDNVIPIIAEPYSSEEERIALLPGILKDTAKAQLDIYRYEGSYHQMLLKTISGVLDISYEALFQRDKQMRKKQLFIRAAAFFAVALILVITALGGIRFFKTSIIENDTADAIELCRTDLYHGMEKLLNLEKQAQFWHIDSTAIREAIRENKSYEKGACLKISRTSEYPGYSFASNIEREFIDEQNSMIFFDGTVYDVRNMNKLLELTPDKAFVLYKDGKPECEYKADSETIGVSDICYSHDNNTFYILTAQPKTAFLYTLSVGTGEFRFEKRFDTNIYSLQFGKDYMYYAADSEIYRLSYDTFKEELFGINQGVYTISRDGVLYTCNNNGFSKKDMTPEFPPYIYLSPDGKYLFELVSRNSLHAVNTDTMEVEYSFDLPDVNCELEFSADGKTVIYSSYTDKSVIYKDNMFYMCFDTMTGEIVDSRDISYIRGQFHPDASYMTNHRLKISDDGDTLIYSLTDTTLVMKNIVTGEEAVLQYDDEIVNLSFYNNGDTFRVFLKSGEAYTVAAESEIYIRNLKCTDIICDIENINNCLITEGNIIAQPLNYGEDYRIIYEADGELAFAGQTKNYFLFYSINDFAGIDDMEIKYYKCGKKNLEVSPLENVDVFELLNHLWDYENDIVYDYNTKKCYDIVNNVYVDAAPDNPLPEADRWMKVDENHYVRVDDKDESFVVSFAEISGSEYSVREYARSVEHIRVRTGEGGFVIYGAESIVKYDASGNEIISLRAEGLKADYDLHGYLDTSTSVYFDKKLSKACYIDSKNNAVCVADIDNAKMIYQFKFDDNKRFAAPNNYNDGAYPAKFNADGDRIFITYADMTDKKCFSELIDLNSGKSIDKYEGYPVIFNEYWNDGVLINKGHGNVSEIRSRLQGASDIYTFMPVFDGYADVLESVHKLLAYINA